MSIAIAALLLFGVPAAPATQASATPFDLLDDGSIIVAVTIGGTGPYRFVLDTGSSRTVISARLSKALRLQVVAKTLMVTPAGRHVANIVRLEGLAVDGRPGVNLSVALTEADRYAAGQQVDGLIGQDVLAAAVFTIDYRDRCVIWHAPGDSLPGRRLPLNVRDNRLLVTLAQHDGDPRPLHLVPDSGSDGLVLFTHAQDKLTLTYLEVGLLTGLSASRLARRVQIAGLVVGQAILRNPTAVVVDNRESAEMMGDGLLPLHFFSRVTFNVAERYLIVTAM